MARWNLKSIKMNKIIQLRTAIPEDCWDLLAWRNDPVSIQFSPTGKVEKETHRRWFNEKLCCENTKIFIITNEQQDKIGMLRFDKSGEESEISINLNPKFRGQGYGEQSLRESLRTYFSNFPVEKVWARIMPTNEASIKVFRQVGFQQDETYKDTNGMERYLLTREEYAERY